MSEMSTIIDILQKASGFAGSSGYIFLEDDEEVSYSCIFDHAKAIAVELRDKHNLTMGERALLVFPPGKDFVSAYFGCLCAGIVAVPVIPPESKTTAEKLRTLIEDAKPSVLLTNEFIQSQLGKVGWIRWVPQFLSSIVPKSHREVSQFSFDKLRWVITNNIDTFQGSTWEKCDSITPPTVAMLQYTSGSTSTAKGVVVTHGNLVHNLKLIQKQFGLKARDRLLLWLPPYHDMGLIGGILAAPFVGMRFYVISPMKFLQSPSIWMQLCSTHKVNVTGAPNFAFELSVHKSSDVDDLDLSKLRVLFNGAEPLRVNTFHKFYEHFRPYGLNKTTFRPCYGLAESSLMVTSGGFHSLLLSKMAYDSGLIMEVGSKEAGSMELVSSGVPDLSVTVLIVDPNNFQIISKSVGEIWVSSKSVANGYWRRESMCFQAYTSCGKGPFLRTGDLGFFHDSRLYISGRIKDVIIVSGRNYYPQDVEMAAEAEHPLLRQGCCAAFSLEIDSCEELLVVLETRRIPNSDEAQAVFKACLQSIRKSVGLQVHKLLLVPAKCLPKTTSGKIKRSDIKKMYCDHNLPVYETFEHHGNKTLITVANEESAMLQLLKSLLGSIGFANVKPHDGFFELGLKSHQVAELTGRLQQVLKRKINPAVFWEYTTIADLAVFLMGGTVEEETKVNQGLPNVHDIAVLGVGCHFPGETRTPEQFWDMLSSGRDAISVVPWQRWDLQSFAGKPEEPGTICTQYGGFIGDVESFDADFFNIKPAEAKVLDPQHRQLLEVVWECLENSGVGSLKGTNTGVFVGIAGSDYGNLLHKHMGDQDSNAFLATGIAASAASGRISNFLDTRGAAVTIDTACSSSLVALCTAIDKLQSGDIDGAIVAGVNVLLDPRVSMVFSHAGMLSHIGRCQTFADSADGYVRSEGCGAVFLRRFPDVVGTHLPILAVVKGGAVNQDGGTMGLTVPSKEAQSMCIKKALWNADTDSSAIEYVEAHGTGTKIGDPLEVETLTRVYGNAYVGSVKNQIGHMEAAAGIGGFIKTVLMLQHDMIPGNLHINKLSCFFETFLKFPTNTIAWPKDSQRACGISSFGLTGTNAHVIVTAATLRPPSGPGAGLFLLTLSAKEDQALESLRDKFIRFLAKPQLKMDDVAFTTQMGRTHFDRRMFVVGKSQEEVLGNLSKRNVFLGNAQHDPHLTFLFAGQGSQKVDMGLSLYNQNEAFRKAFDACNELLPDISLLDILADRDCLNTTKYAHLAICAVEYSFFHMLSDFGVSPHAVIGHSLGELVAAMAIGIMSLSDGLRLIQARGCLMNALPHGGGMLAVTADEVTTVALLTKYDVSLEIANINEPMQTVVSGSNQVINDFRVLLERHGVLCKILNVSHSFHSTTMTPMLEEFRKIAESIIYHPVSVQFISTVTGTTLTDEMTAEYWVKQITSPVMYYKAVENCNHSTLMVEVGVTRILSKMAKRCVSKLEITGGADDWEGVLSMVGQLYLAGVDIAWRALYTSGRQVCQLPNYPFQRKRHWVESLDERSYIKPILTYVVNWVETSSISNEVIPLKPWIVFSSSRKRQELLCNILGKVGVQTIKPFVNLCSKDAVVKAMEGIDYERVIFVTDDDEMETLLYIVQATSHVPVVVLTTGVYRAGILGIIRSCRNLTHVETEIFNTSVVGALASGLDKEIRFCKGKWLVPRIQPMQLNPDNVLPISVGGTQVITGGLGGIGLMIAKWLVEHGAKHLVLVSRSKPSLAVRTVIDQLNATVQLEETDVSQILEVENLFSRLTRPVEFIFHAAGVLQFKDTANLVWSDFEQTLAAKGAGTLNILKCAPSPKRVVLFSSAASVFGLGNSIHYAAANAVQEAIVDKFPDLPIRCIAWDRWNNTGMNGSGCGLMPSEALSAMKSVIECSDYRHVLVSSQKLIRLNQHVKLDCLENIQRLILNHKGVKEVLLSRRSKKIEAYICADMPLEGKDAIGFFYGLEKSLSCKIPRFLLPCVYIMLSAMPTDLTQLPDPSIGYTRNRKVAHKRQLAQEVLNSKDLNEDAIFFKCDCDVISGISTKGLIGMAIIDRDEHLIPTVFEGLGKALELITECEIGMLVSLRPCDTKARAACLAHCPERLNIIFKVQDYEAHWGGTHSEANLLNICHQRNLIRRFGLENGYDWVLNLDSDIVLRPDTIQRLLLCGKEIVYASYRPRWSAHNVISTPNTLDATLNEFDILINPEIYTTKQLVFRSSIAAAGCLLVRKSALHVEFAIADVGFLSGEDIGFCMNAMKSGHLIFCLTNHIVQHLCEFYSDPLIPQLDSNRSLLVERQILQGLVDVKNGGIVLAAYPEKSLDHKSMPSGSFEIQVAKIWAEITELDQDIISRTDTFEDLGGHSLQILQMNRKLQENFGVCLEVDQLYSGMTVAQIAASIQGRAKVNCKSFLIHLSDGPEPTVYFIHGGFGLSLIYCSLKDLGQRMVRLDNPKHGEIDPFPSMGAMAQLYVDEIIRTQPTGPYILCGFCLGGEIVLEMARLMSDVHVILIDSYNPDVVKKSFNPSTLSHEKQAMLYTKNLEYMKLSTTCDSNQFRNELTSNIKLSLTNSQTRYNGPVYFMKASRPDESVDGLNTAVHSDNLGGWGGVLMNLTVIEVNGTHHSIFEGENLVELRCKFRSILDIIVIS